jgi:hypothetical protein
MANRRCFCGCGAVVGRFPLFIRSVNNLGRDVTERLAYTRSILGEQMQNPNFASWGADGDSHIVLLRDAMHDHTPIDQDELQRWMRVGREIEKAFIDMGGPPIRVWLNMPDEMRESEAYAARLDEIRAVVAKAGETATSGGV